MANIKSQKKRIITNEKNRQRNVATRSRIKTLTKNVETAVAGKNPEAVPAALTSALSAIDRAVTKGIIHRNTAARKKSAIMQAAAAR